MNVPVRGVAAIGVGIAVAVAVMAQDRMTDRPWAVTAAQIADARASGQPGVAMKDGTIADRPVPSADAGLLPLKWASIGLGAGALVFVGIRRRRRS